VTLSYSSAHRLHRQRLAGKPCEHCARLEVALKPDVPAERLLIGTGHDAGLLYSELTTDYELLCARHHRLRDSRERRIRKARTA
jgi:hypothetical protein